MIIFKEEKIRKKKLSDPENLEGAHSRVLLDVLPRSGVQRFAIQL